VAEPTGFLAYIVAGRDFRCKTVQGKCLLQYYCSNVSKDGTFFKSMLDICADTSIAESTVREFNGKLKGMGVLSWIEGSNLTKRANTYTLHLTRMKALVEAGKKLRESAKQKAREQSAERSRRYREKHSASR
jgi:hypothetical protein